MKIEMWPIERVKPYASNPRVNDAAIDAVAASLKEFGWRQPLVVDGAGILAVGHTRWKAALKLGLREVPVHVATDLTEAQVKAYRLADNATNEIAEWDYNLLPIELKDLEKQQFDLGMLGFSPEELARLMSDQAKPGLTDPDDVPDIPEKAETQPGDIWLLGEHRLLCGDATKPEDVARLLNGETAKMLFCDPPWNVGIGLDSNPRHRQRRGLQNDDLSPEQFKEFLNGFAAAVEPHIAGDCYVVLGASEWPTLDSTLRSRGFHWSATIIWVKDTFVLGRSKFHRRYEPVWFGWREKGKSSFNDRRDVDDVWEIPRPKRSVEHATMKPTELPRRAICNSSVAGDIVLDTFGGSGSTLIAAEQSERRAYLMEIDPLYCEVIVRRFEKFTGMKAKREVSKERTPARRTGVRKAGVK